MAIDPKTVGVVLASMSADMKAFIVKAKEYAKDGLTIAEIGSLFNDAITFAVQEVEQARNIAGAEKKELVMAVVSYVFDTIAPFIPLPFGLSMFRSLITPYIKQVVLLVADGTIEAVVVRLAKPKLPETSPAPAAG